MDDSQVLIKSHCMAYLDRKHKHQEELARKAANYRPSMREMQGKVDMPAFVKKDSAPSINPDSPDKSIKRTTTKTTGKPSKKPGSKVSTSDLSKSMTMKTPPDRKLVTKRNSGGETGRSGRSSANSS